MKTRIYYIVAIMLIGYACSSTKNLSSSMEDDIYFVPGQKPLVVKEVEQLTGQTIHLDETPKSYNNNNVSSQNNTATVINRQKGRAEQVNIAQLSRQAQQQLADNEEINAVIYENPGYWVGGFNGSENDINEAARIISRYPEGFGYIGNGQDIATNLSFNSDWNVYTENGRYWWFPSNSNIDLYTTFIFGTYPKYSWTVAWNSSFYDSWTFDSQFNINIGWGRPSLSMGFGNGFYNPWPNNWYGPYYGGGWYDPWWGGGYYPHWGHNHHWHGPHWGDNYPNWNKPSRPTVPGIAQRPNYGGGISGVRPNPGSRPIVNGVRPGVTRPNGSTSTPIYNGSVRPGSGTRPGSVGNQTTTRPGNTVNRPSSGTVRPGNVQTRPATSTTVRPTNSGVRPTNATRSNNGQYTRPATNSGSSSVNRENTSTGIKNYSRPQNSNRPTYNNNSSSRYNSGSSTRQTTSPRSGSSYTPQNSGRSNQSTPPPTQRSTTRTGGTGR